MQHESCEVCLRSEKEIKKEGGYLLTWGVSESEERLTACNSCYNYGIFNPQGVIAILRRIKGIEDALANPIEIAKAVLGTPFEEVAPELKAGIDQLMKPEEPPLDIIGEDGKIKNKEKD